jgi:hypothetical protein
VITDCWNDIRQFVVIYHLEMETTFRLLAELIQASASSLHLLIGATDMYATRPLVLDIDTGQLV